MIETRSTFQKIRFYGGRTPYWEGKLHFCPTGGTIEAHLGGDLREDFRVHVQFLAEVENSWEELSESIRNLFKRDGLLAGNDDLDVFDRISSLSIPNQPIAVAEWEITFSWPERSVTVCMKGLEARSTTIGSAV